MSNTKFSKIAGVIERRIDKGDYPTGSKLPTHRVLSEDLGTTPATVAKAYKLLSDKGRLESFVGKGTFVCEQQNLTKAIQVAEDETSFNFSILQPCLNLNIPALELAYKATSQKLTAGLIGYTEHSGHEDHRQAGVVWAKTYGLEGGSTENTVLTNGAQHALSLLINALTEPGDTIAVEELTYPGVIAIASLSGRNIVGVAMDEHGISPSSLSSVIKKHSPKLVVIIPSHQNPTGITMPEFRRKEVATIIEQESIWLVEDDIYGFLNETPIPAISNFIPEHSFHISALSKAISPAMRCGYIKAPDSQVSLLNAHIRANIWLGSPINNVAATVLIESGKAQALAEIQRNEAIDRQALAREVFPTIVENALGYHLWLPLPDHWSPERFVMEAKNRGVIVSSGSYFEVEGSESNHIRISLMSISTKDRLKEGLNLIHDLLNSKANTLFPF